MRTDDVAKKKRRGVSGVLDVLTGENAGLQPIAMPEQATEEVVPQPQEMPPSQPEEPQAPAKPARATKAAPRAAEVIKARRGRPLGSKTGADQTPKKKVTVYIPEDLWNDYIAWTWVEHCSLSDLAEWAMIDYKKRKRPASGLPTENPEKP